MSGKQNVKKQTGNTCDGIFFEESAAYGHEGTGEVSLYFNAPVEFGRALAPGSYENMENLMLTDLRIDVPCIFNADQDPESFDLEHIGVHVSPVVCDDPKNDGTLSSIDWADVCLPEELIRHCIGMAAEEDDLALDILSVLEECGRETKEEDAVDR